MSNQKMPKDPKRSFKIRSTNMMKKSSELTNIGARIFIYMERGDERVVFRTHPDLLPDWNAENASQVTPADLPTQPDFEEFRLFASASDASGSPPRHPSSGQSRDESIDPALETEPMALPTLPNFYIPGLNDLQVSIPSIARPVTPPPEPRAGLDVKAASKRERPVSAPMSLPRPPKRARRETWFE